MSENNDFFFATPAPPRNSWGISNQKYRILKEGYSGEEKKNRSNK
jgi:hypothetical protein